MNKNLYKKYRRFIHLLILVGVGYFAISATTAVSHRVFTIGDSTVQDYNDGWAPRKGWGQMLQSFFSSADVQVINRAVGGTSSRSFYNSFWSGVKGEMKSGDFLFIQFGINDRAADETRRAVGEDFKNFLRSYVNEARAMGVIPVLVSTVRRDAWSNGLPYDSYHEHPQLVRDVAAELNVPLIDLDKKQYDGMVAATNPYTTRYWSNTYPAGEYSNYPNGNNDQVHFQEMGAIQLAKYVIEGIQALSTHNDMKKLIPFIKPQYPVTVSANHPEAGLITRTETYPSGLNLHMKALANSGHKFINWKDGNGTLVTTNNLFQFTMGTSAKSYVAFFDDEISMNLDCNGTQNGTATLDNCGICTGGTTGKVACTTLIQAETACSVDGMLSEATNSGFMGIGYVNTDNALASKIVLSIYSFSNQTVSVAFRFANGGTTNRNMALKVNDVNTNEIMFPPTGNFTTWKSSLINISLKEGNNLLELSSVTDAGGPNIDLLAFYTSDISTGSCETDCQGVFAGNAYLDSCNTCVGGTTGELACVKDCAGEWSGKAYFDNCGSCIHSENESCIAAIQGEDVCFVDGVLLESTNLGFLGEGYVNTTNVLGAGITFKINAAQTKSSHLSIRYANGGTSNRDANVIVNDVYFGTVSLPPTGAWTSWLSVILNINLQEGLNEIRLESNSDGGLPNIDLISWNDVDISEGSCLTTHAERIENNLFIVSPNPFVSEVTVTSVEEFSYQIYNYLGVTLEEGVSQGIVQLGKDLPKGSYILSFQTSTESKSFKVVKQ